MARKIHLFANNGVVCQRGKVGMSLRGEFIAESFAEFKGRSEDRQCSRCKSSSYFTFLLKTEKKSEEKTLEEGAAQWTPEADDAWKKADDALIATRRTK